MSSNPNKESSDKTPAEKQQPQKSGDNVREEGAGSGEEGGESVKKAKASNVIGEEVGGGSSSVLPPRSQPRGGSGSGSGAKTTRAAGVQVGGIGGAGGDQQGEGGGSTAVATAARAPPTGTGGRAKRKAEIIGPVGVEMVCSVCKRDFGSWKALSGHMRSHPERQWRGIFPPPVEPRFAAAQGLLQPPNPQAPPPQPIREERVALDVDLNQPQQEEEEEGGPPPDQPEKDAGGGAFDLNKPPASGDGDE